MISLSIFLKTAFAIFAFDFEIFNFINSTASLIAAYLEEFINTISVTEIRITLIKWLFLGIFNFKYLSKIKFTCPNLLKVSDNNNLQNFLSSIDNLLKLLSELIVDSIGDFLDKILVSKLVARILEGLVVLDFFLSKASNGFVNSYN